MSPRGDGNQRAGGASQAETGRGCGAATEGRICEGGAVRASANPAVQDPQEREEGEGREREEQGAESARPSLPSRGDRGAGRVHLCGQAPLGF